MALTGNEVLEVQGLDGSGRLAATTERVTVQKLVNQSGQVVAAGSTLALTASDAGATILLNTATGSVVTLPAATGSGQRFTFVVTTAVTSGDHKILAHSTSDFIQGNVFTQDSATVTGYSSNGTADHSLALNGSTTGGLVGDQIELVDVAANLFQARGITQSTGVAATPFSTSAT